jgi:hypothetical protein
MEMREPLRAVDDGSPGASPGARHTSASRLSYLRCDDNEPFACTTISLPPQGEGPSLADEPGCSSKPVARCSR